MPQGVYLLGAARTDFRRNLLKEGKSLRDVIAEAARGAIADGGVEPGDVQSAVVGNFAAGLFTHQLHVGAMIAEVPGLRGIPTVHTEAACASGSVAVLTAAQQIMAGVFDLVLVVGAEQQKTMSPAQGADVLGAAGDYRAEQDRFGDFMFPKLFGHIAQRYAAEHELSEHQLAAVAAKNLAHARLNPDAQMRNNSLTLADLETPSENNPLIAAPLKASDCSQITDGAAALLVCSESFARRRGRASVRLLGFGQTTDRLAVDAKDVPEFPYARKAAARAYEMAGIGPRDLHAADVHDCFSISEIIAYEILGFAERGRGGALVESGATALSGVRAELFAGKKPPVVLPVNPGGGLIGDGHPVGATGVRQVVEAYRHLTGTAGARQVEGARRYLTFNMGGTMTTNVVMIWGAEPEIVRIAGR